MLTDYKQKNWIKLICLIIIQSTILLILLLPLELFGQNTIPKAIENTNLDNIETKYSESEQDKGITIGTIKEYAEVISIFLEVIIIILLAKTVKDFAELAKVSKLQTEVRFRPWVGPHGGIEFMRSDNDNKQYFIKIKNFGEIPASNVTAISIVADSVPKKDFLSTVTKNNFFDSKNKENNVDKFSIGPLLPGMEKRYWVFIKEALIKNAKEGTSDLFISFYFSYDFAGGKSGYGMISKFDKNTDTFVHIDMWID